MLTFLPTASPLLRPLLLVLPPLFGDGIFSARDRETERLTPLRLESFFPPLPGLRLLVMESLEGTRTVRLLFGGCWRFTEAAGRAEDDDVEESEEEEEEEGVALLLLLLVATLLPTQLRLALRLSLFCPLGKGATLLTRMTLPPLLCRARGRL